VSVFVIVRNLPGFGNKLTHQEHKIVEIDTLKYNNRHYLMNISIGVSPKIMETTHSDTKQRFGFFSYLVHFIQQILGLSLSKRAPFITWIMGKYAG